MAALEKHMLKELLLVCSALGSMESEDDGAKERFVRGENCLEWLQDLQRALRRDDDQTRDILITLASWKVLQMKLIPLILECRDDADLVKTLLKLYVMLTMPMTKQTEDTLLKPVNPKAEGDVRDQQARRRENASAQQASLQAFKRAFVSKDVLEVIVGVLEEPLSHTGVARTDEDNFIMELCLTLLRNILNIKDPVPGTNSVADHMMQLQEQLVVLFQDALLLDILLLLAQDVTSRENAKLNLLLVEIFHSILKGQEPGAIISSHQESLSRVNQNHNGKRVHSQQSAVGGMLSSLLAKERDKRSLASSQMNSRHSRFGGNLQLGGGDGAVRMLANPFLDPTDSIPQASRKKVKKNSTFSVNDASSASQGVSDSHRAVQARRSLFSFCSSFVETAYDPFMRSIKEEFRTDSSRLQPEDKGMFLRLISFFMSFHRHLYMVDTKHASTGGHGGGGVPKYELGHVLETMDIMTFNLILREVEESIERKNGPRLAECVSALKEMVQILTILNESPEQAHQTVALGLMSTIFYAAEPLDKLQDLVRQWQPSAHPRSYLCNLIELVHIVLKALEWYTKDRAMAKSSNNGEDAANGLTVKSMVDKDLMERLSAANDFDFPRYLRRIASKKTVHMYTSLLEHYGTNSAKTNHYILSFFMRLSNYKVKGSASVKRQVDIMEGEEANKIENVSLEGMLYNVHTLGVFRKLLDDPLARKPAFKHLQHYVSATVRHFATLASRNHLVFVEALIPHSHGQNHCEALHNVYCSVDALNAHIEESIPIKNKKKRTKRSCDSDSDSDAHSENSISSDEGGVSTRGGKEPHNGWDPHPSNTKGRDESGVSMDVEDESEEEWGEEDDQDKGGDSSINDSKQGHVGKASKTKGARQIPGSSGVMGSKSGKKCAPRWTEEEDDFLREQYPIYAEADSVFAVLGADDLMEKHERTTEQIQRRVKRLGLTALASKMEEEDVDGHESDGEAGNGTPSGPSSTPSSTTKGQGEVKPTTFDQGPVMGSEIDKDPKNGTGHSKVRQIVRKNRGESGEDSDSDGLFKMGEGNDAGEDNMVLGGSAKDLHQSLKRAIFEDSDDD